MTTGQRFSVFLLILYLATLIVIPEKPIQLIAFFAIIFTGLLFTFYTKGENE